MFYWQFPHNFHGTVDIGPTATEYEAKLIFQARYGYWPKDSTGHTFYAKSPVNPDQW